MKKLVSLVVILATVLSLLVGCAPRIKENDLSEVRYIRIVSRSTESGGYEFCTITNEQTVRSICDTFTSLKLKRYRTSDTNQKISTAYEFFFGDSRGMQVYKVSIKQKTNVIYYSGSIGDYTVVGDININEYAESILENARNDKENAKPIPNEELPKASQNLEFWIGENVNNVDFSGYTRRIGLMGGDEYYGTGYIPTEDEHGEQEDPEHCVIYTVTAYPDYSSMTCHITRITITDPNIDVYGLTLSSDKQEIRDKLIAEGFDVVGSDFEIVGKKGNYTFRFSDDAIRIHVEVTNENGIDF